MVTGSMLLWKANSTQSGGIAGEIHEASSIGGEPTHDRGQAPSLPLPSCRRREQRPRQSCFQSATSVSEHGSNGRRKLPCRARYPHLYISLTPSSPPFPHFKSRPPQFRIRHACRSQPPRPWRRHLFRAGLQPRWRRRRGRAIRAAPLPHPCCPRFVDGLRGVERARYRRHLFSVVSSLGGVDGEDAPCASPPSPIPAGPASSTVSAASSAPATGAYLGGITGHRLGQEEDSGGHENASVSGIHVPSSRGIAFVSFGQRPQEVLFTDLRLGLGSVSATDHMTNPSSAGQQQRPQEVLFTDLRVGLGSVSATGHMTNSSSAGQHRVQAQQQQSGRCPKQSRICGSSSSSQLDHLPPPAGAGAAVADMVVATTVPLQPPPPPTAAAAAGSSSPTMPEPGHGGATPTTSSSAQAQAQAQVIVTRDMWLACAAPKSGRLPAVGSLVYYFPDGHAEQCPSRPQEPLPGRIFLCKVTDVRFRATTTNEALATISLVPVAANDHALQLQAPADPGPAPARNLVSFVKRLTYTDAAKNRFIVPKDHAAVGVLPYLQLDDDVPLRIKDLNGKEWAFNYTRRAHSRMFRSGWMEFATANSLVTGDNVVFMRCDNGDMFVGVRRKLNRPAPVLVEEVIEAVWQAARCEPLKVSYCSRQDGDEFVVPRDIVDEALSARFTPGMAVNFVRAVEEGKLLTIGPQEEVISIENYATSIWRMIQIGWTESSEMNKYANFWQVRSIGYDDLASAAPPPPSPKRLKSCEVATASTSSSACNGDEQVQTMRNRLEALLPDNIKAIIDQKGNPKGKDT
uniref:TF-B3 domain-containing protein n=1 Tax=Oryza punctata TaxID=4537 RepID=A0A0E0MG26_ORYPU